MKAKVLSYIITIHARPIIEHAEYFRIASRPTTRKCKLSQYEAYIFDREMVAFDILYVA